MEVIITGGRYYNNKEELYKELDEFHAENNITLLIEGGASGADNLALQWAKDRKIPFKEYKADWKDLSQPDARIQENKYGKYDAQAGHRRNQLMITNHSTATVLAFKGNAGTRDCMGNATKAGLTVKRLGTW